MRHPRRNYIVHIMKALANPCPSEPIDKKSARSQKSTRSQVTV
jgi:hypothetical protein